MAVKQNAIDHLRLDEAFTEKMLHRALSECWTVKCDELLLVVDDETKVSRFGAVDEDIEKGLLVFNEQKREIVLLSIDNQLFKSVEGGVADCALFDDKQFRFVEFKMNAEGNSDKAIKKTFDKATRQLINSIRIFKDGMESVDVCFADTVAIKCHVVLSKSFPRSRSVMQNFQMEFALNTEGIPLDFSSETYWEIPYKQSHVI